MKAWVVHVVFAAILIGSLAANGLGADLLVESDNLEPAVLRIARSNGLVFRGYTTITSTAVVALAFAASGCPRPVLIVLLRATFDQVPIVRDAGEQGNVVRYVYIDRTWDSPHRLAVFVQRMKYAGLMTIGLTRYIPSWHLLRIESPAHCQVTDVIDWRNAWNRDYLRATRANTEVPTK
jgi:hypothetical protein